MGKDKKLKAKAEEADVATDTALKTEEVTESSEPGPSTKRSKVEIPDSELLEIDVEAPTPLSKAEIRAAKKRVKEGKPALDVTKEPKSEHKSKKRRLSDAGLDDDNDDNKEERAAKNDGSHKKASEKPKKQNSVWIGNISFKTTQDALKAWLDKGIEELGGKSGAITRVNLPKKKGSFSGNNGYAYVDFDSPETQAMAVQLSEKLLEGRQLLIKLGDDHAPKADARTPKPVQIKNSASIPKQQHPPSATLFVGNLAFDTEELGLRDHIESHADPNSAPVEAVEGEPEQVIGERGGVKSGLKQVRMGTFEDTGRCKGFAFLDFLTIRHATAALAIRENQYIRGRKLLLQYASESAANRSGGFRNPEAAKKGSKRPQRSERESKRAKTGGAVPQEQTESSEFNEADIADEILEKPAYKKPPGRNDQRGKKWEQSGRPRPGAALAMAKRENVGIVASAGSKVVFD